MKAALRIAVVAAVVAGLAGSASAGLLVFDQFDYTGALTDNGWVAHSGAGNKVIMADGSAATLEQSDGSGEDVNLAFAAQGATDTTYAGFDLTLSSADNADIVNVDGNGMYFAHFKDSGFSFRARTGVVVPSGGGDYGLAVNGDISNLGAGATWASDLSFDTTYRVVISWDASTGEGRLWLDAASESDTSIAHTGTNTGNLMEAFALRQSNDYTGMQLIDNVIAGTTFDDVVNPEPTIPTKINELRIGQSGTDNDLYFELSGGAGDSLDGLTYLVIGDDDVGANGSGVIEIVVDLTGQSIPADGFFLAGADTFTLATPDLVIPGGPSIFEGSDNVTHMLVSNFTGANLDDLDTDDDGILDVEPWDSIVDCVGLVASIDSGDLLYCDTQVGPDGSFVPAHAFSCPDGAGDWQIGNFGDFVLDTPGEANACLTGSCCLEGACSDGPEDDCIAIGGEYQGDGTDCDTTECISEPGACCLAGACSDVTLQGCDDIGGTFNGGGTDCLTTDCSVACTTAADAEMEELDVQVNICNAIIISTTDLIGGESGNFHIQDDTGGVTVFSFTAAEIDALLAVAGEGDKINLVGQTNAFAGLFEISDPFGITLVEAGVGVPDPTLITMADLADGSGTAEFLESTVVELPGVTFLDGDGVATFAGGENYDVTDDGGTTLAVVRISSSELDMVGTIIPVNPVSVRGILSQFTFDDPADNGYQIMPRRLDDIFEKGGCENCGTCDADVNCDEAVDPLDTGAILARFGLDPCANDGENCIFDVNCDGSIDPLDSGYVLARFGTCEAPVACDFCSP